MARTNAIGAFQRDGLADIGALEQVDAPVSNRLPAPVSNDLGAYGFNGPEPGAYGTSLKFTVSATGGTLPILKPTAAGTGNLVAQISASENILILKPTCLGEARIIFRQDPTTPTIPIEDLDNGSLLQMSTNVRRGAGLIRSGDSTPIIDLDGIRYLLDVDTYWYRGAIIWTRFSIATRQPLDTTSFTRPYAAHNIFGELLYKGSSTVSPYPLQTSTFPDFDVPFVNGTVSP